MFLFYCMELRKERIENSEGGKEGKGKERKGKERKGKESERK